MNRTLPPWASPLLATLLSVPLLWLASKWAMLLSGRPAALSAEPVAYSIDFLGLWAIRLLIVTLAISPLARFRPLKPLARLRRVAGLATFGYALCHLLMFTGLDLEFSVSRLVEEIVERRYILFGMAAFLCLLPLAVTSTGRWQRRLGRRWLRLHRLVFVAAALATIHYVLLTRGNQSEPLIHGAIIALLILERLWRRVRTAR